MSIQNIPGIQYIPASHRCHRFVLDFVVATSSIASYMNVYHNRPALTFAPHIQDGAPQYPASSFEGQASGKSVDFVPDDVLKAVFVQSLRNSPIPYVVTPAFTQIPGVTTGAIAEIFEGLAQAMFTGYWETNLKAIEAVHGKRKAGNWPAVLRFAAVVRDAMSHGGTLNMFPAVQPVSHFGLNYDSTMNGKKIIHNDLTCADIFYLMLEIDTIY